MFKLRCAFVWIVLGLCSLGYSEVIVNNSATLFFDHSGQQVDGTPEDLGRAEVVIVPRGGSPDDPTQIMQSLDLEQTIVGVNQVVLDPALQPLIKGQYDLYVRVFDIFGNFSDWSPSLAITKDDIVDTTKPTAPTRIRIIITVETVPVSIETESN